MWHVHIFSLFSLFFLFFLSFFLFFFFLGGDGPPSPPQKTPLCLRNIWKPTYSSNLTDAEVSPSSHLYLPSLLCNISYSFVIKYNICYSILLFQHLSVPTAASINCLDGAEVSASGLKIRRSPVQISPKTNFSIMIKSPVKSTGK